jgi:hypothetical protein
MSHDNIKLMGLQSLIGMDGTEAINNRQQRIRFRWIKEGLIRCMDSDKGNSGCSEFMIYPVKGVAPTIRSRPDHIKLLITDEAILESLMRSVKRQG